MVSGAKEEVDRLESIIRGMDVAGERGSVPKIIPLKYANVGMILHTLQEIFTDTRALGMGTATGVRRTGPPPVITADESGNALIVRGTPTDISAIQKLVDELDTEDKRDRSPFRIIPVKLGMNVVELADQIETTLNESSQAHTGGGTRSVRTPSISVTPNVRTNSLVLAGYAPMFDQAEALVRKLEELGPPGGRVTAIVPMRRTKVEDIQRLIDQLTQQGGDQGQRGGGRPRPASRPRSGP
jgi:type II secretory pathway component GspD/PulD (secretin)